MAEEGAPFLTIVPAQERKLPEPPQPANSEAVILEAANFQAVAVAPPSAAMVEVKPNVESKARPTRTKPRKADAKSGTKTESKTTDKGKRGKAARATAAGPKAKGSNRTDQ